jgi:hypothetical protein
MSAMICKVYGAKKNTQTVARWGNKCKNYKLKVREMCKKI